MLFNSLNFLLFFPITTLLYFVLPKKIKNDWLLIASYIFYMGWNPKYALLLFFSTSITYVSALFIQKIRQYEMDSNKTKIDSKVILILALILIFILLFYYKYLNFSLSLLQRLLHIIKIDLKVPNFDIILPVGISFFTFQAAGYLIDVYKGEIEHEKNFFTYALFVSFFPQLVAGPIERSKNLLGQIKEIHNFNFERMKSGIFTMLYGYILKMIIADRAAILVDFVYSNEVATGSQIAFATFIFAFQIYCDFYGYSTIAKGASRILGIELMENFNAPYFANSIKDFWRRWHISLSTWFRDYIYINLGGNRKGKLRKNLNIMIVMLVSGIWHGAGVHFIFWGFLNGFFQIAEDFTKDIRNKIPLLIQKLITFCIVCFCWLFFRANSVKTAFNYIKMILLQPNFSSLASDYREKYSLSGIEIKFLLLSIFILFAFDYLKFKGRNFNQIILSKKWYVQSAVFIIAVVLIAIYGSWGAGYNAKNFIYFQF